MTPDIKTTLRTNQEAAVQSAMPYTRFIISTGTGSGKTLTALEMFARLRATTPMMVAVVLTTKSAATTTWPAQIREHTTFTCGVNNISLENDISVVSYSQLTNLLGPLGCLHRNGPVFLILDEAHKIKSEDSALAMFLRKLIPLFPRVLALTATTMMNHLEDVYWLYESLFPGIFGDINTFMDRYTTRVRRDFGTRTVFEVTGYKFLEDLAERIKPVTYSETIKIPVDFDFDLVTPTSMEEDAYLRVAREVVEEAKDDQSFGAALPRLQHAVNNSLPPTEQIQTFDLTTKEARLLHHLREIHARGEGVIVFSFLHPTIRRITDVIRKAHIFDNVHVVTGKSSDQQRGTVVNDFTQGDCLIASSVAAESLNLQEANNVIFYCLSWSSGTFIQAVGRIARMNSRFADKRVIVLGVTGTIDEYKMLMLRSNMGTIMLATGAHAQFGSMKSEVKRDLVIRMRGDLLWKLNAGKKRKPHHAAVPVGTVVSFNSTASALSASAPASVPSSDGTLSFGPTSL